MTDFFVYRSCDVTGTEARRVIQRNQDILNRGIALIEGEPGVPADDTDGSDNPDIPIVSAVWGDPVDGNGELPPGTYDYKIIPVNTCTGRTGKAKSLPPLTISALGKVATLRMKLSSKPTDCNAALIQRNGRVVGNTFPTTSVGDNVPIVNVPDPNGTFNQGDVKSQNGLYETFHRTGGADLIVGDVVQYQGFGVQVTGVSGNDISFAPPIPTQLVTPTGFYSMEQRTGVYESFSTQGSVIYPAVPFFPIGYAPQWPFGVGPLWPGPFFSFKVVGYGLPSILPFISDIQPGDIINYGSKTALVIHVETNPLSSNPNPSFGTVLVVPFGLLPIPPLPAGIFQIVYRTGLGGPKFGLFTSANKTSFRTWSLLSTTVAQFAVETGLTPGAGVIFDLAFESVGDVQLTGNTGILGTEFEVTVSPELEDFMIGPVNVTRPIVGFGPWVSIPKALSPYLIPPNITATGNYVRLSRLVTTTVDNNILQFQETGAEQERSGTVDGTAAKKSLDQLFVQNNYPGGLTGLLDKVRGPRVTTPSSVFVKTNGTLVQIGQKLKAVNKLADKGNGTKISLTKLRLLREQLCGSWDNVKVMNAMLQDQGFVAARFEAREVFMDPAKCPPGQPDTREVRLFCVGLATPQVKVKDGEQVRFYWAEGRRTVPGTKKKLMALGLTADEADSAAQLATSGRLLSVEELTTSESSDVTDFGDLGPSGDLDGVLDDTRIGTINTGPITRVQIGDILRGRGNKGIIKRPPGTDPATFLEPDYKPIEDFSLPAHNLAGLALSLQLSFDVCDFDAALDSLPDGQMKTALAALFAIIEASLNGLVQAGRAILDFIQNGPFSDALDAITALIMSIASDPTLACLIGPAGSAPFPRLDGIAQVDQFLQGFAFAFQVRFDLSQLLGEAIASVLCTIIGALTNVIGQFGGAANAAFLQRAIGCLPLNVPGLEFPSLDVQIAIECSLDQLNTILDIIQELIAEANEIIDLINNIGAGGFVMRAIEARNNACSSGADLQSLVGSIAALAGG
jgi:hypothetical protein